MINNKNNMLESIKKDNGIEIWELMSSEDFKTCIDSIKEVTIKQKELRDYKSKDCFYYIRKGHGVFKVEDESQQVNLRDLIYIPANEKHSILPLSPKLNILEISIKV